MATVVDGLEHKEEDARKVGKAVFLTNDQLQNSSIDQMSKNNSETLKDEMKIPYSSDSKVLGFELKQNQDKEEALPDDAMIVKENQSNDKADVQDIPITVSQWAQLFTSLKADLCHLAGALMEHFLEESALLRLWYKLIQKRLNKETLFMS